MRRARSTLTSTLLCGTAALSACGAESALPQAPSLPTAVAADEPLASAYPLPMLPAYPTAAELEAGKADASSEYKLSKPTTYNITAAPGSPMSPAAEFAAKQALLVSWTGSFPDVVATIVAAAKPVADVWVVHYGSASKTDFLSQMSLYGVSTSGIQYLNAPLDSIWIRDFGPMSLHDADTQKVLLTDARYYHERYYDDAIPKKWGDTVGLQSFRMPVKFEGGNFMSDGRGTCVVSQGVLWYNNISQTQIEQYFREYMGCYQLIVMNPLDGEGTTHIDMFTKLVDENTVVLGEYKSSQDATNKALMDDNEGIYGAVVLADGGTLEVVRMPMPSNADGNWRTYVNSQLINNLNLIPVYQNDTTYEAQALSLWKQVLPSYQHVEVDASELITWSGAVHCILMEVAKGDWAKNQTDPAQICSSYGCYPTSGYGNTGCEPTTVMGSCNGSTAKWCDFGATQSTACGAGQSCGYQADQAHYGCAEGETCIPSCAGKACGSDGCGGACGTCGAGYLCQGNQCVADASSCGDVKYEGCCSAKTLQYCEQGELKSWACQSTCGWSAQGYYDCGGSGADPSGEFALACPGSCTPQCGGKACGDNGCGGSCGSCGPGSACTAGTCVPTADACDGISYTGCCAGQKLEFCDSGALQVWNCASCGWNASLELYDCGFSGSDPSGTSPKDCPGACSASCTGKKCGDDGCGGSCGTCAAGTVCDGAGQCLATCTPKCTNKACGDDGCGGSCGTCAADQVCNALGACATNCTPACGGKTCGEDGCGGSCGVCNANELCQAGHCEALPAAGCGDISWEGVCAGDQIAYCADGELVSGACQSGCCGWVPESAYYDCYPAGGCSECYDECEVGKKGCSDAATHAWTCQAAAAPDACTTRVWTACPAGCDAATGVCKTSCTPSCAGKQCGADGCGGSCGNCAPGEICNDTKGFCELAPCFPKCGGKECGSDGCGGLCGDCAAAETCSAGGLCVAGACQPACGGKQCGGDGCGGSCGECGAGEICSGDGKCTAAPTPCGEVPVAGLCKGDTLEWCKNGQISSMDCAAIGKSCGLVEGEGYTCVAPAGCTPECTGKACGPDGCGGVCGSCPNGQVCTGGACQDPTGCGDVTYEGVCQGNFVQWCENATLQSYDCSVQGKECGFKAGAGYTCIEPAACAPLCAGKQCGEDGCGGSCGTCGAGLVCEGSLCVEEPTRGGPEPSQPGPDGAGTPDASGTPEDGPGPPDAKGGSDPGTRAPQNADVGSTPLVPSSPKSGCEAARGGSPAWLGWLLLVVLGGAWAARRSRSRSAAG